MISSYRNIPEELKRLPQWAVHKKKIPYNPKDGTLAKSNDPNTWGTFCEALKANETGNYDGLSFAFNDQGIVGIDLDHCVDEQSGGTHPEALNIIQKINSYTEFSPSGTGFHIYAYGQIPGGRKDSKKQKGFEVEMYKAGRFFTVTGNIYEENKGLNNSSNEISKLFNELFKKDTDSPIRRPIVQSNDDFLSIGLEKDSTLISLWNGDRPSSDESSSDMALMNKLVYWANCDKEQAISAFLSSPYAASKDQNHMKKMGRRDYLERTAETAIKNCRATAVGDHLAYQESRAKMSTEVNSNTVENIYPISPAMEPRSAKKRESKPLQCYTAKELGAMDLKPPDFIVYGLLPVGVTILAAPSKIGKSWLSLDLALSVSEGKPFIGYQTNKSGVFYLALEDSLYRLRNRMDKLLKGEEKPDGLVTATQSENMMNGFIDQLDVFLKEHNEVKLVIIDTFQRIKPPTDKNSTAYEADYRQIGQIKELAIHYNMGILLVHHTRKGNGIDGDVFEKILGSTALQGATDTMMVITKDKRTDKTATLTVTGRDVSQQELCIRFDKEYCRWYNEGTVEDIEEKNTTNNYESDPLVITIRNITQDIGFWEGSLDDLKMAVSVYTHAVLPESGKALSTRLDKLAPMLASRDNIEYRTGNHPVKKGGISVRLHSFQKYYLLE